MEKNTAKIQKITLSWIVVSDLAKATKFFTECVGLKISQASDEYGWVELSGYEGGAKLGLVAVGAHNPISSGHNAITTFTVDNIRLLSKLTLFIKIVLFGIFKIKFFDHIFSNMLSKFNLNPLKNN